MVSVVAALRSAGIADQHIRTSGLAIAPQYQTQDSQLQHMTGYVVRSTLEVETDDIQGVPALLDTAMAAGANRVDRIVFESSVLDDLRAQARDQAWQSARVQADQLAQRAGTRLDHLTSADEPVLEDTTQIQPDRATGYAASQAGSSTSTVQQGEIEVRVRVHLVWATQ